MAFTEEKLYLTPFPFSPLFPMLMLSLSTQRRSPLTKSHFLSEYDYIVVGAGAAGSVVASRLTEKPCINVLLLEAGKPPPIVTDIPSVAGSFVGSDLDWMYRTTPQKHTGSGLINRRVTLGTGKTFGGGSAINALIANRGNRRNYDEWASLGATGWSYDEIFRYFVKLEDNQDPEFVSNGWHGIGGPVTVARPNYQPEIKGPITRAALNLGYRFVDINGPTQHGFWDLQSILRAGQRCSTAKAYLVPSENRTNLDILSNAMATKVLFKNKRAVGVQFDFEGRTHTVNARREVILSAGAINTPKLLMLSGIGQIHELQRLNIPIVVDLPVGQNLQDHPAGFVAFELSDSIQPLNKRLFNERNIQTYIDHRSGPLAYSSGIALLAFLSNNRTGEINDVPDHELYFLELPAIFAKLRVGLSANAYQQVFGPYEQKPILICLSQILHPKSRGWVRLRSTNPYEPPDIDPNYLDDPHDMHDIVEGLKTCLKILMHPALSEVGAIPFNTTFPGCEQFENTSEMGLTCITRAAVMSLSHPTGTAKMGRPEDPSTVVDPELRVKGILGLRVVDASVMPTIIWGNTNLPTIMIAEKASDIMKGTVTCN